MRRRSLRHALRLALAVLAALVVFPRPVPATVEEQRARLPPPATCEDPVEGVWRCHKYNPQWGDWNIFTLTIRRLQPGGPALTGTITNRCWDGGPADSRPPPCRRGNTDWLVEMPARGTFVGGRVSFWGTSWDVKERHCGAAPTHGGSYSYNLDRIAGTVDPALQEFQSVNNDGGRAVNEPMLFRRIGCFEPAAAPKARVAPPPFWPETRGSGCGWW